MDLLADSAVERVACEACKPNLTSEGTSTNTFLKKFEIEELYEKHDSYCFDIPPERRYVNLTDSDSEDDSKPPPKRFKGDCFRTND